VHEPPRRCSEPGHRPPIAIHAFRGPGRWSFGDFAPFDVMERFFCPQNTQKDADAFDFFLCVLRVLRAEFGCAVASLDVTAGARENWPEILEHMSTSSPNRVAARAELNSGRENRGDTS